MNRPTRNPSLEKWKKYLQTEFAPADNVKVRDLIAIIECIEEQTLEIKRRQHGNAQAADAALYVANKMR